MVFRETKINSAITEFIDEIMRQRDHMMTDPEFTQVLTKCDSLQKGSLLLLLGLKSQMILEALNHYDCGNADCLHEDYEKRRMQVVIGCHDACDLAIPGIMRALSDHEVIS